LKFGAFLPLSMMFFRWRLHRKVFLFGLSLPDLPKMKPLLLLADLATAEMGRLDQKKKISKILTPI
jgi:hypothetical protein